MARRLANKWSCSERAMRSWGQRRAEGRKKSKEGNKWSGGMGASVLRLGSSHRFAICSSTGYFVSLSSSCKGFITDKIKTNPTWSIHWRKPAARLDLSDRQSDLRRPRGICRWRKLERWKVIFLQPSQGLLNEARKISFMMTMKHNRFYDIYFGPTLLTKSIKKPLLFYYLMGSMECRNQSLPHNNLCIVLIRFLVDTRNISLNLSPGSSFNGISTKVFESLKREWTLTASRRGPEQ